MAVEMEVGGLDAAEILNLELQNLHLQLLTHSFHRADDS